MTGRVVGKKSHEMEKGHFSHFTRTVFVGRSFAQFGKSAASRVG